MRRSNWKLKVNVEVEFILSIAAGIIAAILTPGV